MPTELALSDDVLARLRADDAWWDTADAQVPDTPQRPYAVVWPSGGSLSSDRLGYRPTLLGYGFQIVCAGWDRPQVLDLVGAIRGRLIGWQPYPESKSSGRVVEVPPAGPLIVDTVAGETRMSLTLTFRLSTTRS